MLREGQKTSNLIFILNFELSSLFKSTERMKFSAKSKTTLLSHLTLLGHKWGKPWNMKFSKINIQNHSLIFNSLMQKKLVSNLINVKTAQSEFIFFPELLSTWIIRYLI